MFTMRQFFCAKNVNEQAFCQIIFDICANENRLFFTDPARSTKNKCQNVDLAVLVSKIAVQLGFQPPTRLEWAPRQVVGSRTLLKHSIPCRDTLSQASVARVPRGWRFTVYSLAIYLKRWVFSERSHRTTHNATLSVTSVSFFLPAAPRGFRQRVSGLILPRVHRCVYYRSLRAL